MDVIGIDAETQSAIDIVQSHVFFKPDGNGWRSKPELPTAAEVLADQSDIDDLPKNPVDAPWASKEDYLTAQYEILRCEAVEGLRYSVRSFADNRRRDSATDDDFTNIYTRVRVREYIMSSIGPLARVSFSTERSKYGIQWRQSKRLQPGKIVALSPKSDNFKTICKVATIAQRPYRDGLDQDPPLVDLIWADSKDAVLDPNLEMVMIESLHGYFESARHSLIGLQHAARTDSPLDKYLTGAHSKDNHPEFLNEHPVADLSKLASRATVDDAEAVEKLKTHDIVKRALPDLKDLTNLDESQLLGLHRIISKELAIVQGPPGTGKTFTSVEALKVLVANRRKRRGPPIIVAAQTNHALDQILIHCINSDAEVLRMGGRTQNDLIKPRTLFELRMKCGKGQIPADKKCGPIDHQRRVNATKIQELVDQLFSDRLLEPKSLLDFGIITQDQYDSLCDESMETHEDMNVHGPFAVWLGESLIPAKIREDRHPTQHERNEAEARQNLPEFEMEDDEDIENIADDEEDAFRFRGQVIRLRHVWSGKDPANLTSWGRAVAHALQTQDMFDIDRDLRGAVYQYFQGKLLDAMAPKFAALLAENVNLCKKRKAFKFLGNTQVVDKLRIDIVGCTTTGLTKYRGCLAAMNPQSLLIEEAAETREANIVSALYPSIQQLILVGDHKQLAPKCDIQRLGDPPYNLNVSLFQRMVNLDMPFVMLKQQRRMKPELRKILKPFYPELYDHPSVASINNRPDVLGMGGCNSWLFDHMWPEDMNSDFSKFNEEEAEMITKFFAYLVANGTPSAMITVLTFYKGQRKVLLRKLKRHPSLMGETFNVCTVDSYQGEENDIILLSLVRSPQLDRAYAVGFLEDERRAVVAISRARRGFYVFGNVSNVLSAHQASYDLWFKICSGFSQQGRLDQGQGLPLVCQVHHKKVWMKEVEDWGDNAGGCDCPCEETRPCGHPCTLKCHPAPHNRLPCSQPCRKRLDCGHGCHKLCGQECFCDCKAFKEAKEAEAKQAQASKKPMSLMEKMVFMGAEETRMLKASLSHPGVPRLQAQPAPTLPAPGQVGFSRGGRNRRQAQPARDPIQAAQTAAQWGQFVDNIKQHDEELLQEHRDTKEQQVTESVIWEAYHPTSLANGQRTGGGSKTTQKVKLPYNKVAAASVSGQSSSVWKDISHLTLTNEPDQAQPVAPPVPQHPSSPSTRSKQPPRVQPSRRAGKGGRKNPPKKAPASSTAEPAIIQQPQAQQTPVSPPPTQVGLLIDAPPENTVPQHEANEPHAALLGFQMVPHPLTQVATLTPSSATSTADSSVSNETTPSRLLPTTPVDIRVQAQPNEGQNDGPKAEKKEEDEEEDEDEEWLIDL